MQFLADYSQFNQDIQEVLLMTRTNTGAWIGLSHDLATFTVGEVGKEGSEMFKDFTATMLKVKKYRQLVKDDVKICQAIDGANGSKYGKCLDCPYSKFRGDDSPECSEYRTLLLKRDGVEKPEQLSVPSSSLKAFFNYINPLLLGTLSGVAMPVYSVVTKFKAVGEKKGSRKWAKIEFEIARPVADINKVVAYMNEHAKGFILPAPMLTPAITHHIVAEEEGDVVVEDKTKEKKKLTKAKTIEVKAEVIEHEVEQTIEEIDVALDEIDDLDF